MTTTSPVPHLQAAAKALGLTLTAAPPDSCGAPWTLSVGRQHYALPQGRIDGQDAAEDRAGALLNHLAYTLSLVEAHPSLKRWLRAGGDRETYLELRSLQRWLLAHLGDDGLDALLDAELMDAIEAE